MCKSNILKSEYDENVLRKLSNITENDNLDKVIRLMIIFEVITVIYVNMIVYIKEAICKQNFSISFAQT